MLSTKLVMHRWIFALCDELKERLHLAGYSGRRLLEVDSLVSVTVCEHNTWELNRTAKLSAKLGSTGTLHQSPQLSTPHAWWCCYSTGRQVKVRKPLIFPTSPMMSTDKQQQLRVGKPWQFPCLLNDDVTAAEVSNSRSSFHYFHATPTIHKAQVSNINSSQIQKALAVFLPNWWWYCYSLG